MKKLRFFGLFLALAMGLSLVLAACKPKQEEQPEETPLSGYTVTVLDPDDKPYPNGKIEAWANGKKVAEIAPDQNGVAKFGGPGDKVSVDKEIDEIEVRLIGIPEYFAYETKKIKRGDSVTVKLRENLSIPKKGEGKAEYREDVLTGGKSNLLDTDPETFKPYEVGTGVYALKFTQKGQKIYFEFQGDRKKATIYSVSVQGIEVTLVHLPGDLTSGIRNMGDEKFEWKTGEKAYEFTHDDSLIQQADSKSWFEVSMSDGTKEAGSGYITFAKVGDYAPEVGPETESILPAKQPAQFEEQDGEWTDAPLDGTLEYEKDAEGFYRVGGTDGPLLCATVAREPRGYDVSFEGMYQNGQSFTDTDGKTYSRDYYPLLSAYAEKANKDGVYPLNDELKTFLNVFLKNGTAKEWIQTQLGTLPEGEEWLFACGYYKTEAGGGTEGDEPIFLLFDEENPVKIPAGGTALCTLSSMMAQTVSVSVSAESGLENVTMKWYGKDQSGEPQTISPSDGAIEAQFEVEGRAIYYVAFENAGSEDLTISVLLSEAHSEGEDGSEENPYLITEIEGTFNGNSGDGWTAVNFVYTAEEAVTIRITFGEESDVTVCYHDEELGEIYKNISDFEEGEPFEITLKAGVEYKFMLSSAKFEADIELSFTITVVESGS